MPRRLELFRNADMLLMFEKDIRGGITQGVQGYNKTSNK